MTTHDEKTAHATEKSVDDFTMFDPETMSEPNQFWNLLRETAPVHTDGGYTQVSRYADVQSVLRDADTFRNGSGSDDASSTPQTQGVQSFPAAEEVLANACPYRDVLAQADGEPHALHRRMVRSGLGTRRVRQLEEFIATVVDELLDDLVTGEPVEFMSQFCKRLPIQLISEIMGLERTREREDDVYRWAMAQMAHQTTPPQTEEEALSRAKDVVEFHQYVFKAVADRRETPRDDFLSELVANSEGVTEEELVLICVQLILGGADTSIAWLGEIFNLLLEHPDQLAELYADRSLVPQAMEEALRLESVVKYLFRTANHDTEVGGQTIPAGTLLALLLGSANRDDSVFPDAATFDIRRSDVRRHLAFGFGKHLCVGVELARAEVRIALEKVLERTSGISRVEGEPLPKHKPDFMVRVVDRLPIILHPAER